ncbi:sigma-70 family RNA polymerase sigma factor [uncultured Tissierella sp.]|uniref:sigma-70 family RNA polymerase sigma factor n=1 Tax=uncultured Tissierella sp. TaxID=448160 RepID=UPI0028046589|nr:sigma-70 family RNA polymerase sigma factor [uncultured Tissierella sp.]MDU5081991.1 sigma-70 family RNA polymerase sigma factor [Bacillota bacterium]
MIELEKPLSELKQLELLKKKDDPKIKEKLILHNLRLVNWISKKYAVDKPGRESEDLFQEGVIGLINAIDDYDPKKGSFSNYAVIHISGSILRSITNTGHTIRIPSYMVQLVNQYKRKFSELEKELGREPTPEEMALEMDLAYNKVIEIINLIDDPISLNTILRGEENDMTLEDTISDDGPLIEEFIESKVFIEQFKEEFKDKIPELEFESIRLFYGLDCPEHTLKEIGEKYNKSIERVREARNKGLRVVRQSNFIRELDNRTTWIRSIDYSEPRVTGGLRTSPVERIVLEREELFNKIKRQN